MPPNSTGAGKGDKPRPCDKGKYDACPLWKNIEKKNSEKNKTCINKSTMKNYIAILIMFLGTMLFGQEAKFNILDCGQTAVFGRTMSDGSYIEELVDANHYGRYLTPDTFANRLTPVLGDIAETNYARELYGNVSLSEEGFEVKIAVDLLAWRENHLLNKQLYKEYMTRVAEVGETVSDVEAIAEPEQPGFMARTKETMQRTGSFIAQQYEEHPIRSTLVTIGSILLLDYWEGGGIDGFGVLSSGSGGGSNDPGSSGGVILNANSRGQESPINVTIITGDGSTGTSDQTRSNAESTAAPFFPPQ